jgi:DNA end-binding protein Ku
VRLPEFDPIFFETSYYAAPDWGGESPALLFTALSQTDYAAVGSLAKHGREQCRAGRRGLILHTLFYENEAPAGEEHQTDPTLVNAKELDLAKTLIHASAAPFDASKLNDTFEERLRGLINSRTEKAVPTHGHGEVLKRAPVTEILEALKESRGSSQAPKKERIEPSVGAKPAKKRLARSRL